MGKPRAPYTMEEFDLFPGVVKAVNGFRFLGYLIIVVTNRPDVARGWVSREAVDLVHERSIQILNPDEIKACFQTETDHCLCRKPLPGMLLEAQDKWQFDPKKSFMIGNRFSDLTAGRTAGTKTILIGEGEEDTSNE